MKESKEERQIELDSQISGTTTNSGSVIQNRLRTKLNGNINNISYMVSIRIIIVVIITGNLLMGQNLLCMWPVRILKL
jgi:hypothetical protein